MKRNVLFLILNLMLFFGDTRATMVTPQTAEIIAINFFKVNAPVNNHLQLNASLIYTQTGTDNVVDYYIFDISPVKGFVIVAADDNLTPVIGYSTETNFNLNFSRYGINSWMKSTAAKIQYSLLQHIPANSRITYLWDAYKSGQNPNVSRSGSVGPLLQTTWDQEPNYNQLCPYSTADQQRAVTGCVATAMAQIMRYWSYPAKGKGSFSYTDAPPTFSNNYGLQSANFGTTIYRWTNMPLSCSNYNNSVDTLMYQCGVSVAMDYGDDNQGGSGAWVLQTEAGPGQPCSQYSFVNYFQYDSNTIQGVMMSEFSASDWMTLMQNELNANRLIQYEGDDVNGGGGHTWVCDGYDANNMLHMNWGWSGQSDGYFAVTNLDAASYNFTNNEGALIGIQPPPAFSIRAVAASPAICPGGGTTLTAQGPAGATFTWTPTTGLSCATCATTQVTPANDMIYTVTADSSGVKGSATVAVRITPEVSAQFSVEHTTTCSVPAGISFVNSSVNATNYTWDFGDGTMDSAVNPVHYYNSYGPFNVRLISANACFVDSVLQNQVVSIQDLTPSVSGQSICSGQTATLSATGTGEINWYDAVTNGNLVDTGATFTTAALNTSTIYYVSSTIASPINSVGPVDNTLGAGGYFSGTNKHSVIFNCTTPQTLLTVDVYAQTAGSRTIQLQDSNGAQLQSVTVNIPAGPSTVTLNMPIPVANELYLAISGNDGLYRNNAAANYPYTSSDGTIVITGSDAGTPGYYYFFYNWKLQQSPCVTTPVPVVASVVANGSGWFNAIGNGNTVSFSTPATGITYYWSFGDGNNATMQNPIHTYVTDGTYTVTLVESNGVCNDTITQIITTAALGVQEVTGLNNLSLFPNPAKEQLTLNIMADRLIAGCRISIHGILGQHIYDQAIEVNEGANSVTLDISSLSSGIYFFCLQNGKESITRKFVKAE